MASKQNKSGSGLIYVFAYLLTWLSGIVVVLIAGSDKRAKFHGLQALFFGIVLFILWWIPIIGWIIGFLGWLYGLYIGYLGYTGKDAEIPVLGGLAKQYSK